MILAFDYGTSRIGLAVGQSITATATPLPPVRARDGSPDWQTLETLVAEWQPDAFVVGLPLNMDGTPGEISFRARKFANRLTARFKRPSYLMDERLSTFEAKGYHLAAGGSRDFKTHSVDSLAAQLILESWFAEPVYRSSQDKL